ncbi:hypothetical protein OG21DRAFT_1491929 [Imleria badia]|nr:hypothetical protein OG21DRAFT_1491929 [Imleria badia]
MFGEVITSLDDNLWLHSICPESAHSLSLFPRSTNLAQDFSHLSDMDHRLLEGMLHHVDKNNLSQLSCTHQTQWLRMIQTLLASVLLGGAKPSELEGSSYHIAFKEGLDRPCSSTISSFLSLMKNSSKVLLYHAYSQQCLRFPDQLIPMVEFDIIGSDMFKSEVELILPSIEIHFWQYLHGIGDPQHFIPDLVT